MEQHLAVAIPISERGHRDLSRWVASAAAVSGAPEVKLGKPCQDFISLLAMGPIQVATLADGAGSASLSHIGAETVARETSSFLGERFDDLSGTDSSSIRREIIDHLHDKLRKLATQFDCCISDLASTLQFVATNGCRFIAGNIGDGVLGHRSSGRVAPLFLPQRGEFASETFFISDRHAESKLQVLTGPDASDGYILMSDGTADSLYLRSERRLARAVSVFWDWHKSHPSAAVSFALEQNLREVLRARTKDDCSVVVLTRIGISPLELRNYDKEFRMSFLDAKSSRSLKNLETVLARLTGEGDNLPCSDRISERTFRRHRRHLINVFPVLAQREYLSPTNE